MTASAPKALWPGRTASAGRPAGGLWILLLVGLMTALPCAGQARAVTAERHAPVLPAGPDRSAGVGRTAGAPGATGAAGPAGPEAAAGSAAARAAALRAARLVHHVVDPGAGRSGAPAQGLAPQRHRTWCSADGEPPSRNNGCSSHPFCPQDAQLPNPPPQPQPAAAPQPVAPEAAPRVVPSGLLVGPHPAPDLHELQVHRS